MIGLGALLPCSRSPRNGLTVELTDADRLAADRSDWDDLVGRALAPHPYYSAHVIEAHRANGLAPRNLAFVAVRREGSLEALLPYTLGLDITGFGRRVAMPFRSPFTTATTPLLAAGAATAETLAALVEGLREASGGRCWRFPFLSVGSDVGQGLQQAMREAGWSVGTVAAFERPVLDRRPSHDAFAADHPHKSRLKDLRRRERRLAEAGTLSLDTATDGDDLAAGVEAFLTMEAAGWKGEAGTAFRSGPRTESFARGLFAPAPGPVTIRADTLSLDGRLLAISLALVAGRTAFLLKTTYDERRQAQAPGLVLEAAIVRSLHDTRFADRLDSATLPGSALESLYREREPIAEIVAVPPGGDGPILLDRRIALARFERRARADAKRVLRRH